MPIVILAYGLASILTNLSVCLLISGCPYHYFDKCYNIYSLTHGCPKSLCSLPASNLSSEVAAAGGSRPELGTRALLHKAPVLSWDAATRKLSSHSAIQPFSFLAAGIHIQEYYTRNAHRNVPSFSSTVHNTQPSNSHTIPIGHF